MASTTALPPPTCTARQEAGQLLLLAVVYYKACAGRIICWLFALPAHLCHAMPTAHVHFAPFCFAFPRPLFIAMCARIVAQFARTALWQLQHGPAVAARAPCLRPSIHPSIHPSIRCVHCVCHLSWHGDCVAQLMRRCVHCVCHLSWHGDCVCAAHAPLYSLRPY